MPQRTGVRTVVAVAAGVLGGVLLDRAFAVRSPPSTSPSQREGARMLASEGNADSPGRASVADARAATRQPPPIATKAPKPIAHEDDVDEEVQAFRVRQSAELIGLVQQRLRIAQMSISGRTLEGAANQLLLYQAGLIDAVMHTAPELAAALSDHIEHALCEPKANPAMQMSMLRMVAQMPDLGSAHGFECVLQSGRPEDEVLWAGLDALRATQLPRGAELEKLARSAKDERTRQRLASLRDGAGVRAGPDQLDPADSVRSVSEELARTGAPLEEEKEEL